MEQGHYKNSVGIYFYIKGDIKGRLKDIGLRDIRNTLDG